MAKRGLKEKLKKTASIVPYDKCYEESGMICKGNNYSVTYKIETGNIKNERYVKTIAYDAMQGILNCLKDFTVEFTIRNSIIPKEDYLQSIEINKDKEPLINKLAASYNEMINNNVDVGNNNYEMFLFLTIGTKAKTPDEALEKFNNIDDELKRYILKLYESVAIKLSLSERLETLYNIYHPDIEDEAFGEKVNFDGNGFSIASMQKMKLTTKEVIAPSFYEHKERNYMRIGNKFVRMFFISSIPKGISDTLFSDLISVSGNSILSVNYHPVDTELGFETAANLVKENTIIEKKAIRNTVEDKKQKRMVQIEKLKNENEEEYFNKTALELFTENTAKNAPVYLCTFVIGLFADTLADLERDTKLLENSASKYWVQIKCCDYQQHEAFISALPICDVRIKAIRTFEQEKLIKLLPLNIQKMFDKKVTFQGLNTVNDNFIAFDRSNYIISAILGAERMGKTFSMKRDVANELMTTEDTVIILSKDNCCDDFVTRLDGKIYEPLNTDLFTVDENYNLTDDAKILKKSFIESFIFSKLNILKQKFTGEELDNVEKIISAEAEKIAEFNDYNLAVTYANENYKEFKWFLDSLKEFTPSLKYPDFTENRLNLLRFTDTTELLTGLNYVWNFAIAMKKAGQNIWIYIDGADDFLYSSFLSDYLISLVNNCIKIRVPMTLVINNSTKAYNDNVAAIELDYLLSKIEYAKIHPLNVIERKRVLEKLGVSTAMIQHIQEKIIGTGIIVTPTTNVAFDDCFEKEDNEFYNMFI